MFRVLLVSAIVALAAGASPRVRPIVPMLDGRIVGGVETTIEQFPHQLSLLYLSSHTCGASIISPDRALTAAHCTDGTPPNYLTVRGGSSKKGTGGVVIQVSTIAQHPKYNRLNIDYDVSVLRLDSKFTFGSGIQPIALHPIGSTITVGSLCTVSGWGRLSSGGASPTMLQKVEVPHVGQKECQDKYVNNPLTERMFCCGYPQGGKDSCQGDSGGPLIQNGVQVGVVSWGIGCASASYPGVYARVANKEIQDHITGA